MNAERQEYANAEKIKKKKIDVPVNVRFISHLNLEKRIRFGQKELMIFM